MEQHQRRASPCPLIRHHVNNCLPLTQTLSKTKLMTAAVTCLHRNGFAATRSRDIAAQAGVSLRSISYHYGSTRGLLVAAISNNWRTWLAPLIAITSDQTLTPEQRLRDGMTAFSGSLEDNEAVIRAWLEAVIVAQHDPELRQVLASNQNEFQAALAQTLAGMGLPDPHSSAAAVVDICDGAVVRHLLHGQAHTPAEIAATASRALNPSHRT